MPLPLKFIVKSCSPQNKHWPPWLLGLSPPCKPCCKAEAPVRWLPPGVGVGFPRAGAPGLPGEAPARVVGVSRGHAGSACLAGGPV